MRRNLIRLTPVLAVLIACTSDGATVADEVPQPTASPSPAAASPRTAGATTREAVAVEARAVVLALADLAAGFRMTADRARDGRQGWEREFEREGLIARQRVGALAEVSRTDTEARAWLRLYVEQDRNSGWTDLSPGPAIADEHHLLEGARGGPTASATLEFRSYRVFARRGRVLVSVTVVGLAGITDTTAALDYARTMISRVPTP